MADYVEGRDVGGENDDGGCGRGGRGGFAQGFDDFFHAALEGFVFCRWKRGGLLADLISMCHGRGVWHAPLA